MKNIIIEKSSINTFIPSIIILLSSIIFVYVISDSSISIATTSSLSSSSTTDNIVTKSNGNSSSSNNENIVPINSSLLYESKEGNIVSQRVVNVMGEPQIETSTMAHGILSGIGNVTNIETWIDTYRTANTTYGEGEGIISSENGQMAPWIGYDIGQIQSNGTISYKGVIFFNNNATGNMKFLDNLVGLEIATNHIMKILKW